MPNLRGKTRLRWSTFGGVLVDFGLNRVEGKLRKSTANFTAKSTADFTYYSTDQILQPISQPNSEATLQPIPRVLLAVSRFGCEIGCSFGCEIGCRIGCRMSVELAVELALVLSVSN